MTMPRPLEAGPELISEDRLATVRRNYQRSYEAGDTLVSVMLQRMDAKRGPRRAQQEQPSDERG